MTESETDTYLGAVVSPRRNFLSRVIAGGLAFVKSAFLVSVYDKATGALVYSIDGVEKGVLGQPGSLLAAEPLDPKVLAAKG